MRPLQALLISVGVLVSVMLLTPITVLAGTTTCSTADFDITVTVTNANGRSTYMYNLTRADTNPNKFFIYLKRNLDSDGDFRFKCAGGDFSPPGNPNCSGEYKPNGSDLTGGPISEAWDNNTNNDGLQLTSIAVGTFPITIDVTEREPGREEEDETTILLPVGSKLQACGPIEAPMQAQKQSFEGSPLVLSVVQQTFGNGCTYNITSNSTTNVITAMEPVPPNSCGDGSTPPCPPGVDECIVTPPVTGDECETELGIVFCPPGRVGQPPLQVLPGGTCYYGDIKYNC